MGQGGRKGVLMHLLAYPKASIGLPLSIDWYTSTPCVALGALAVDITIGALATLYRCVGDSGKPSSMRRESIGVERCCIISPEWASEPVGASQIQHSDALSGLVIRRCTAPLVDRRLSRRLSRVTYAPLQLSLLLSRSTVLHA